MFKVNNRNSRTRCEIFSKLTIKKPERRHWCRFGVFIVNFEHVIAGWEVYFVFTQTNEGRHQPCQTSMMELLS